MTQQQTHSAGDLSDTTLMVRLYGYLKPYRKYLFVCLLTVCVSKGIEAIVPLGLGKVAQEILKVRVHSPYFVLSNYLRHIVYHCLEIIALLFIGYACEVINVIVRTWLGQKGLYSLRIKTFQHLLRVPIAYYDKTPVGRLITRVVSDIEQIDQMFTTSLIPLFGNLFLLFCIFLGIVWIDWQLALLSLCFVPVMWLLARRFRYQQKICYDAVRTILSAMNAFIQEHLMGASTIRYFNLQRKEKDKFEQMNSDWRKANLESIDNFAIFIAQIELLQNLLMIFVFVVLVLFTSTRSFDAGVFFTFSLYAWMIFRPIADLAERVNILQAALASARRIFETLDERVEVVNKENSLKLESIESICFQDVWFAYEKENWILKGLSLSIEKGKTVAIVGLTGAGKSSIIQLILRFYNYQKGAITINGRRIEEYDLKEVRSKFSLILQDPAIFSGSIIDNLSLFQRKYHENDVRSAISYMHLEPFIQRFTKGIKHELFERGSGLSVGEMQLLSLARAITQNRQIFILDEATASIDIETEKTIQEALNKIFFKKTSLIIAHRLFTVQRADIIFVLHQGTVRESGSHQELLQKKGIYEKLYSLQYKEG